MRKFQFEGKGNVSGDRVRELRLRARLSQTALAAKMQTEGAIIEQDAVSRIESGSRLVTDYELLVLTRIFHVSADWLIGADNHNHRPCRWFAQAPLGPITSRAYRLIESSFYCMMRPTAIEIAAWRILLFVSPWLSVFLNHTLSPTFQTCSSLRSDIFSGHS